jgi:hypothetical protein
MNNINGIAITLCIMVSHPIGKPLSSVIHDVTSSDFIDGGHNSQQV